MVSPLASEALKLLQRDSVILDVARDVSRLLTQAGIDAAVIGGIATLLHGHARTTIDVDVFVPGPLEPVRDVLTQHGFMFNPARREFVSRGVPVHLVTPAQTRHTPRAAIEIDGVRVVSLAALIEMKLRSGTRDIVRAQDLADVIGLIRANQLRPAFARRLPADLRPEFRKLLQAVQREA